MADPVKRVILSYEDYLSMPDDRNRYEILEGELAVTPSPTSMHQLVSRNLAFILHCHIKQYRLGDILYAPMDVILSDISIVQPDLIYITREHLHLITTRGIEGTPDMVIEIISPASKRLDRVGKLQIYAKYGIAWYWLIDPLEKTLEIYMLNHESYSLHGTYSQNDTVKPLLFPGLEFGLGEVWPE